MMNKKTKTILMKRLKSFAWRTGMVVLAVALEALSESLGMFGLPIGVTVTVGLVLGEISKELNRKYDLEGFVKVLVTTKN